MAFSNNTLILIAGDPEKIGSERYFITITCLTASLFTLILSVFHLIMNLKVAPVFIAGGSSLILFSLYALVRFTKCLFIPKLLLTLLGLILLDLTWSTKFLSLGPVLFFHFAFGALVIWVWERKSLIIMLSVYFINIALLFVIEYTSTEFVFGYMDLKSRSIDIYLSFFLYSSLLIFLLSRVKSDFRRQQEKAQKSDKLKSAFLANMSHEIRTPMNAIVGFSELLTMETEKDKRLQYVDFIQNSSENLLQLINELIDLSKIEAGDIQLNTSGFSLNDLFFELRDIFIIELEKRSKTGIDFSYKLPDGELNIIADPLRLKQVLSNLLHNAIKFTSEGSISFSCQRSGHELIFCVSDTGTGIPLEDQEKIFERFTKFDYKGLNYEGSGIGLSIVMKIVELFKGRIWVESEAGKGSSFYFSIPYTPFKKNPEPASKRDISTHSLIQTNDKPVLVVEDDNNSYLLINEILKSLKIQVRHMKNGNEAVNYISDNPDTPLILMDIKLPGMDGLEATRAIKKINPDIPIIAQTAQAMVGDREKALEAGCTEFITKPLNSKRVQELVSQHL